MGKDMNGLNLGDLKGLAKLNFIDQGWNPAQDK